MWVSNAKAFPLKTFLAAVQGVARLSPPSPPPPQPTSLSPKERDILFFFPSPSVIAPARPTRSALCTTAVYALARATNFLPRRRYHISAAVKARPSLPSLSPTRSTLRRPPRSRVFENGELFTKRVIFLSRRNSRPCHCGRGWVGAVTARSPRCSRRADLVLKFVRRRKKE